VYSILSQEHATSILSFEFVVLKMKSLHFTRTPALTRLQSCHKWQGYTVWISDFHEM